MGFASLIIEFRPISNRIPEYCHFEEQLCIILDRISGSSDPEILVDQVSDLFTSEKAIFFLSFYFLQTDLFLEAGIMDDSVQC